MGESDCLEKLMKKRSTIENPGRDRSASIIPNLMPIFFFSPPKKVEGGIPDSIVTNKLGKKSFNLIEDQLNLRQKGKGGKENFV